MPITAALRDIVFDPETIKAITTAYERACSELQLVDRTDPLTELVAKAIISVAEKGERDPDRLRQMAMEKLGMQNTKK
jgi:hypothetical protein